MIDVKLMAFAVSFVTVSVCGGLLLPTLCETNVRLLGEITTGGAAVVMLM